MDLKLKGYFKNDMVYYNVLNKNDPDLFVFK